MNALRCMLVVLIASVAACASKPAPLVATTPLVASVSPPTTATPVAKAPAETPVPDVTPATIEVEEPDTRVVSLVKRAHPQAFLVLSHVRRNESDPLTPAEKALTEAGIEVHQHYGSFSDLCPRGEFRACLPWPVMLVDASGPPRDEDVATARGIAALGLGTVIMWSSESDETPEAPAGAIMSKERHGARTTHYAMWVAARKKRR